MTEFEERVLITLFYIWVVQAIGLVVLFGLLLK